MNPIPTIQEAAEQAIVAADLATLERLLRDHGTMLRETPPKPSSCGGLAPDFRGFDARSILAREHHFASFEDLRESLIRTNGGDSFLTAFEAAVNAVTAGDTVTLERLLRDHAELPRAQSPRKHRATLLHYVGANGVEIWRQKTPSNAVRVAEILLLAGSEIDALANMYGRSTALGLAATSIHPLRAGVQIPLLEMLIRHGADMDHPQGSGNGQCIVNGCLANGRPGAAAFLANRGARLDLEGASGVGRLDAVRHFFDIHGRLSANATPAQLDSGFQWACEYGRTQVVEFMLQQEFQPRMIHRGQTGLHWAAYGGHAEIVKLLLTQQPPIHLKDERFGKAPLGWALYGWAQPPLEACGARYHEIVAMLVAAGAVVDRRWLLDEHIAADSRMMTALRSA